MLPIQFVYTENGEEKSSLDEHKRIVEILEHNKKLQEDFDKQQLANVESR